LPMGDRSMTRVKWSWYLFPSMTFRSMKIPRTDMRCEVLIIGGGLTALVAALEAKKLVDEVVIVSKSRVGRSGNTIVS
jgi:NADPH-dependent 2,4-dienoyl-CoA reductase/sulfur reductase-like enzyme